MSKSNMNRTLTASLIAVLGMVSIGLAASNSKGSKSSIVVGTLTAIEASGSRLKVRAGEFDRELRIVSQKSITYVGFAKQSDRTLVVGLGVKARVNTDQTVKELLLTPPIGKYQPLGVERLSLTKEQVFAKADTNGDNAMSYVEMSTSIYHSPKHGPDKFRKADRNADGTLDIKEFDSVIEQTSWWRMSRRTPEAWIAKADTNRDKELDIKEFALICASSSHIDNVFKRADSDRSGTLNARETTVYIRTITHGESTKRKKNRKKK